jgi:hypothetical protein
MSFELHNEKKYDFERHDTYTILRIAFCYIDRYCRYFVKKYGSRNLDTTSRMEGLVGIVEA